MTWLFFSSNSLVKKNERKKNQNKTMASCDIITHQIDRMYYSSSWKMRQIEPLPFTLPASRRFHRVLLPQCTSGGALKPGHGWHCAETRCSCLPRDLFVELWPRPQCFRWVGRLQRCRARTDGLGDNGPQPPTPDGRGTSAAYRWTGVRPFGIHWTVAQTLNWRHRKRHRSPFVLRHMQEHLSNFSLAFMHLEWRWN